MLTFYADWVDYYAWGLVRKTAIRDDKQGYFRRWPQVRYTLAGPVELFDSEDSGEKHVIFDLTFNAHNPEQKTQSTGKAKQNGVLNVHSMACRSWLKNKLFIPANAIKLMNKHLHASFWFSFGRWFIPLFNSLTLLSLITWYLLDDHRWRSMQPIMPVAASEMMPISDKRINSANDSHRTDTRHILSQIPAQASPLERRVYAFTHSYFSALETANIPHLMQHYAEQVNYYTWGPVDKIAVEQEKIDYFERWPLVKQSLIGQITIEKTDKKNEILVSYLLSFSVENPRQYEGPTRISGQAKHAWRLQDKPDGLKIIEEKQRVLSRHKQYSRKP